MIYSRQYFISNTPKAEFHFSSKSLVDLLCEMNTDNRKIRKGHVEYLRKQVAAGRFVLTNNGIGIDIHGRVFDGQHRLEAIKGAGYPKEMLLIVFGLPVDANTAVDIGIKRTIVDIFKYAFDKPDVTNTIVSTSRFYGYAKSGFTNRKPTPYEVFDWYQYLEPAIEVVFSIKGVTRLPSPVLAAICLRYVDSKDDEKIIYFIERLLNGDGLEKDSPILRLRAYLERSKSGGMGGGNNMAIDRFTRTASALVAFFEGRSLSKLIARNKPMDLLLNL